MIDIYDLEFEEKIALMEQLWEDLSKKNSDEIIPNWHKEVLNQREDTKEFDSIENVKKRLEKYINE